MHPCTLLIATAILSMSQVTSADVTMQFNIYTYTNESTNHVVGLLQSSNFSAVYDAHLSSYGAGRENSPKVSVVEPATTTGGPTTGARVSSVSRDNDGNWVVEMEYQPMFNTYISPFLSRAESGADPRTRFDPTSHPCLQSSSACCLLDYISKYHTGTIFSEWVHRKLYPCTEAIQKTNTNEIFIDHEVDDFITGAIPSSGGKTDVVGTTITMTIFHDYMKRFVGHTPRMDENSPEKIYFFVGVSFFTILPQNAIATTTAQMNFQISLVNTTEFTVDEITGMTHVATGVASNGPIHENIIQAPTTRNKTTGSVVGTTENKTDPTTTNRTLRTRKILVGVSEDSVHRASRNRTGATNEAVSVSKHPKPISSNITGVLVLLVFGTLVSVICIYSQHHHKCIANMIQIPSLIADDRTVASSTGRVPTFTYSHVAGEHPTTTSVPSKFDPRRIPSMSVDSFMRHNRKYQDQTLT